jgi:type II secretory ATPase GspE/PulE/Tfp pilus assembly ATPase PilB-like protein
MITPKEFRKIYIENVVESLNQSEYEKHQLKFRVDSLEEESNIKFSKTNQIKKLLHRTPDIIYLGEILTIEEANAMFHCLAAGLRGFQTIHANNIDSLLNRFLYHFQIDRSCLTDLDLIILMKKNRNSRKIASISEVNDKKNRGYDQIFQFNPISKEFNLKRNLYETNTILKLKTYEDISNEKFRLTLKIYENFFYILKHSDKFSNQNLVALFDEVSYYSFHSIPHLQEFWFNWKKTRDLNF